MVNREEILAVLKKQCQEVLLNWDETKFDPNRSMQDMGVDSLDTILIIFHSVKELGATVFQSDQLKDHHTIYEIVDKIEDGLKQNECQSKLT